MTGLCHLSLKSHPKIYIFSLKAIPQSLQAIENIHPKIVQRSERLTKYVKSWVARNEVIVKNVNVNIPVSL